MAVRDTSKMSFEEKLKNLGPDQDAVLAILDEIGPADDKRILEALNQKEQVTLKSRKLKRKWSINEVSPRRGELENMILIDDLGAFKHPERKREVHLWRVLGDSRLPAASWQKVEKKREPVKLPVPAKNMFRTDYTVSPSTAGKILQRCRMRKEKNQPEQLPLFA